MFADIFIGIDAGTSVIKAVAFDRAGRQLAMTAMPNAYDEPGQGAVEQDMARTWQDVVTVLARLHEAVPDLRRRAALLAVTGQGDGTWLIDDDGVPVAPGWLWLDSRAAAIVQAAEDSGARARIYRHTGCGLNVCNQSAQLAWLQQHRPEVLARAATAMHCKDWLYFNLTGERVTDTSEGSFTFGDFRTRAYADEVLDALGIAGLKRLLPPMVDGARETHPLSAAAAERTGLAKGLPVALGYVDVLCTGLGGGLYDPLQPAGCSIVGSTGMHMRLCDNPAAIRLAAAPTGYIMPFPVPGVVAQMQSNMAATLNIDWVADLACQAAALLGQGGITRKEALAALDPQVLDAAPGRALYHPYIHEAGERGPFSDVNARAQLTGLSTRAGFLDLARAVYEGLAFAARDCYVAMGRVPHEVRMAGGAARSRSFKSILASVLGVPVRDVKREEAGAAGAVMMGVVATGIEPDMQSAYRTWVAPCLGERIAPVPELAAAYDRLFPLYLETRRTMPPIWQGLAAARAGGQP